MTHMWRKRANELSKKLADEKRKHFNTQLNLDEVSERLAKYECVDCQQPFSPRCSCGIAPKNP